MMHRHRHMYRAAARQACKTTDHWAVAVTDTQRHSTCNRMGWDMSKMYKMAAVQQADAQTGNNLQLTGQHRSQPALQSVFSP